MPLVTSKAVLLDAKKRGYAVGAFNANNLEMARGIVEAAEEENAPVIVQVSQGGIKHSGVDEMAAAVKALAANAKVPVVLHLDHGTSYDYNIQCLRAGFTSLMFDGSDLDFADNIKITSQVVKAAKAVGIPVEGELGQIPKDPDKFTLADLDQFMTEPEEAKEFAEKTGVTSLAIAVGNMHKMKIQAAKLNIDRIKEVSTLVDLPLVLHGASGVTDESVVLAVKAGICKINVHTQIAKTFTERVREVLNDNPGMVDLRKYLLAGREALKDKVKEKIRLFGSANKADTISF